MAAMSVAEELASVKRQIIDVNDEIEAVKVQLTADNLSDIKENKLLDKEKQLREEKNKLLDKENKLLDKENKLLDKEMFLMKQQQQQQQHQRKQEEHQRKQEERKTLARHGLPPLGRGGIGAGSPSSSSENKKHSPAQLVEKTFAVLTDLELLNEGASIWETAKNNQLLLHTESDIQGFVKLVLGDAIAAAGLKDELHLANELSVVDLRPDIWLVLSSHRMPVGVIEVKKPGSTIMQKPLVFGQIYDYLLQLQSFNGLKTPFGIVTTYVEWRICWLANDSSDNLAASTFHDTSSVEAKTSDIDETMNYTTDLDVDDVDLGEPTQMSDDLRIVHGTNVMQFDDNNLVNMLATLLHKMTHVELSPVALIDASRSYIVTNEKSWYWARLSLSKPDTRLSSTAMPKSNTQQFWLLKDFRGGVDGRVWLACSRSGAACVIKFSVGQGSDDDKKARLEQEMKLWHIINEDARVRVQRIAGSWALVMPYLRHATDADFANADFQADTSEEVKRWADAGYQQDDAARRHVGLKSPGDNSKHRPVFFDLAHVQEGVSPAVALEYMMKKLDLK
jgi:hypothetical protein